MKPNAQEQFEPMEEMHEDTQVPMEPLRAVPNRGGKPKGGGGKFKLPAFKFGGGNVAKFGVWGVAFVFFAFVGWQLWSLSSRLGQLEGLSDQMAKMKAEMQRLELSGSKRGGGGNEQALKNLNDRLSAAEYKLSTLTAPPPVQAAKVEPKASRTPASKKTTATTKTTKKKR